MDSNYWLKGERVNSPGVVCMKILSLFYGMPGSGSEWERVTKLYKLLSENHDTHLVVYSPDHVDDCNYNIDFELIQKDKFSSIIHSNKSFITKDFDLVFGNNSLAAFFASFAGSPSFIYDMHGGLLEEHAINEQYNKKGFTGVSGKTKYLFKYFMEMSNINLSSRIIVVSKYMRQRISDRWGVNPEKVFVVPNGVDTSNFNPNTSRKYPSGKLIFGYVGGFNHWQGTKELEKSAKAHDRSEFLFVGKEKNNVDNIKYVGRVPKSEVQSYYATCDVLVLPRPSHPATETASPTKFAEYAAMGKPILTTDVGKPADLVNKYNCGIVVEDTNKLCRGFKKFESLSKKELSKMGTNARKMVKKELNMKSMKNNLYKSLVGL